MTVKKTINLIFQYINLMMVAFIMEIGKMGKHNIYSVIDMDVENNIGKMDPFMKDIGHSICLKVVED